MCLQLLTVVENNGKRWEENDEKKDVCAKTEPCLCYSQNFVMGKKGSTPYMWSQEFIDILIEIFNQNTMNGYCSFIYNDTNSLSM